MINPVDKITPQVRILEQPAKFQLCRSKQGLKPSIDGVHSVPGKSTFPVIEIRGWKGSVKILVSCVTKESPYRPHPFRLVGKRECKNDVYVDFIPKGGENKYVILSNVGIQSVEEEDVAHAIEKRKALNVDPFQTGFKHSLTTEDLTTLRLCVNVYVKKGTKESFNVALAPVVSDPIRITDVSPITTNGRGVPKSATNSYDSYDSSLASSPSSSSEEQEMLEERFSGVRLGDDKITYGPNCLMRNGI